jgi:TalC/MipB family fructose-6-phosphate aldolase
MQIWLDTINLDIIADGVRTGIIAGVTTNPSILAQTKNVSETLAEILNLQKGAVAIQVTSPTANAMIKEGRRIFDFSPRAIIKVPVNHEGLIAMRQLIRENIPVLGTGVIHPTQALLAASLGATYIAPYFCHIGDIGQARETLAAISKILIENHFQTKMMAAALRSLDDLVFCAKLGINAVTIKDDLYKQLMTTQPIWDHFSQKFASDWKQTHGNVSIGDLLFVEKTKLPEKLLCFSLAERL